jgi:hypothetical protein
MFRSLDAVSPREHHRSGAQHGHRGRT